MMYSLRSALLGSALLGSTLALSLPVAAMAQNTTPAMNGSAIQISGIVEQASDDLFVLNYGPGKIVVEMDDWDSYPEARALMDGDHVTVFGLIDHDEYEAGSIEAETVFVQELNAYFEASADDEDGGNVVTFRHLILARNRALRSLARRPPHARGMRINCRLKRCLRGCRRRGEGQRRQQIHLFVKKPPFLNRSAAVRDYSAMNAVQEVQ